MVTSLQEEVNERKYTEQNLLQLNQLYSVLSETNQAIVHTSHQDSLFQEVCRVAVQHGCFKMAWIGLVDQPPALFNLKPGVDWIRLPGFHPRLR